MTFVLPLARTIVLTDAGTARFSATLALYDGTPIGVPAPSPPPPSTYQMDFRRPANARFLGATL